MKKKLKVMDERGIEPRTPPKLALNLDSQLTLLNHWIDKRCEGSIIPLDHSPGNSRCGEPIRKSRPNTYQSAVNGKEYSSLLDFKSLIVVVVVVVVNKEK